MIKNNTFSTVGELEEALHKSHSLYSQYVNLGSFWKPIFEEYMLGRRTLPLTYDPFFKRIFNPEIHPDRLSDFLSSILGQKVMVTHILPNQNIMLKGSSLFIMDIVVRLKYVSEAEILIDKYPWLEEIFIEMSEYMHKPGEVLSMFSEALRIMDENTALYMIDEMKNEISEQNEKIDSLKNENKAQRDLIANLQAQLDMYKMNDK